MSNRERIKVWFDKEGDYLDVSWGTGNAYYVATENERVLALVDTAGNIYGFKILDLSGIEDGESGLIDVDLLPVHSSKTSPEGHLP